MSSPSRRFFLRSFCMRPTRKLQSDWPGMSGCFSTSLNWGLSQKVAEREEDREQRSEKWLRSSVALLPQTWIVPAAAGGAAPPPLALVQRGAPLLQLGVLQGVRGQVADLQGGEFAQEVAERHPGKQKIDALELDFLSVNNSQSLFQCR